MAKSENIIRIPQPPSDAFNKYRPVSDLLWTQVEHLAAVIIEEIDDERQAIMTEEQASAFIKKYTVFLHAQAASNKLAPSSIGAAKKTARSPNKRAGKRSARSSKR